MCRAWRRRPRLGRQVALRRQSSGCGHGGIESIQAATRDILSNRRTMGDADGRAGAAAGVSLRARDRGQDRGRRGSLDADLFALCRTGDQALRQARRYRDCRPAAVHGRSHRHGAGAERLHHRFDRAQQGALVAQPGADQRQAAAPSVRRQGGPAQGGAERPGLRSMPPRTTCAPPRSRSRPRATGCAFWARPTRRSPSSRRRARSIRPRRSTPRSPARSCSARSDRDNMSAPARAIRSSSSAICPPSGWSPMSARPRRRTSISGRRCYFTVLAYPDRSFPANISYVAAALDPTSRRLLVRATVNNSAGLLKPEMFASVKIFTGEGDTAVAVPRDAVIYEGETARVWVAPRRQRDRAAADQGRADQRQHGRGAATVLRPAIAWSPRAACSSTGWRRPKPEARATLKCDRRLLVLTTAGPETSEHSWNSRAVKVAAMTNFIDDEFRLRLK